MNITIQADNLIHLRFILSFDSEFIIFLFPHTCKINNYN
jgi:hypothetical protein